jgi:hypothetical protein
LLRQWVYLTLTFMQGIEASRYWHFSRAHHALFRKREISPSAGINTDVAAIARAFSLWRQPGDL